MKTSRETWRDRFLCLALFYSTFSKDPSTKVGCVIVDHLNRPIGWGTNGFARTSSDAEHLFAVREEKYKRVLHAEENAIYNATDGLNGATAYLTHPPCLHCCHVLAQNGIAKVVAIEPTGEFAERWHLNETTQELNDLCVKFQAIRKPNIESMIDAMNQYGIVTGVDQGVN